MALRRIALRDFVIVQALDIDLHPGFTVLTGETGAGKSILIDALQLALGARADAGVVREGARQADICAEFDSPAALAAWLEEGGYEPGDTLLLRRVVDAQGKSRAWINGGAAPPIQPRIAFEATGAPPKIRRDRFGNAIGGVRLPEMDVPIAQTLGSSKDSEWLGQTFPFTAAQLKALYPTHQDYVAKVAAAAERALAAGVILPYRVDQYIAQARAAAISS